MRRTEYALPMLNDWFDRKEYMKINKGISTATASRDLRQLLDERKLEAQGEGRMTDIGRLSDYPRSSGAARFGIP